MKKNQSPNSFEHSLVEQCWVWWAWQAFRRRRERRPVQFASCSPRRDLLSVLAEDAAILTFRGRHYPFSVSGMSVGVTIGASTNSCRARIEHARSGRPRRQLCRHRRRWRACRGAGGVQLQNEKGVILQLAGGKVGAGSIGRRGRYHDHHAVMLIGVGASLVYGRNQTPAPHDGSAPALRQPLSAVWSAPPLEKKNAVPERHGGARRRIAFFSALYRQRFSSVLRHPKSRSGRRTRRKFAPAQVPRQAQSTVRSASPRSSRRTDGRDRRERLRR